MSAVVRWLANRFSHSAQNAFLRTIFAVLSFVSLEALPLSSQAGSTDNAWQPIREESLSVVPGSALDFSGLIKKRIEGVERISIKDGHFRYERDGERATLVCASLAWSPGTGGFPNHKEADLYVEQLKLHGYNVVRFHYLDAQLMSRRSEDFDLDPVQLDNLFYFLAKLKERGIYWIFDAMSSPHGLKGGIKPHQWVKTVDDLKLKVYYDASSREHWKAVVKKLFDVKNPYTKVRILDDQALLGIVLVNENSLDFYAQFSPAWPPLGLQHDFNDWLRKKYKGSQDLVSAWGGVGENESVERNTIQLLKNYDRSSARMTDQLLFYSEKEIEAFDWMSAYLRELGYVGGITSYHDSMRIFANRVRGEFSWVDMHTYHDHGASIEPGAKIEQSSAISNSGRYLRDAALTKLNGKAFSLTEYGQPFWNKYRYEAGPMAASMAALQGWDFICLHAWGPVDLAYRPQGPKLKQVIYPYGGGVDPIVRASETVATYVIATHALEEPRDSLAVALNPADFSGRKAGAYIAADTSTLAWMTKIRLEIGESTLVSQRQGVSVPASVTDDGYVNKMLGAVRQNSRLTSIVNQLRAASILKNGNLTDVRKGVYESATGQVLLERDAGRFSIDAPTVSALMVTASAGNLGRGDFRVKSVSDAALISAMALDLKPLSASSRVLIVFATDAGNTGMSFDDESRRTLKSLGVYPPRVKGARASVELKSGSCASTKLYALRLDGSRKFEVPLVCKSRSIGFSLDNLEGADGPTLYYELEKTLLR